MVTVGFLGLGAWKSVPVSIPFIPFSNWAVSLSFLNNDDEQGQTEL